LTYKNTKITSDLETHRKKVNNILSQMYSRNRVRNIFATYCKANNVKYDAVIMCRFDFKHRIQLKLETLDLSYLYNGKLYGERKIIADNLIIMPMDVFLKLFNLYTNISVLNSSETERLVKSYGEEMVIGPEGILFANYIYNYKNVDKVKYINEIAYGCIT
jgi:hypothetical protein